MSRTLSLTSLFAVVLFFALTYATKSQAGFSTLDQFGFPLVFFTADNDIEHIGNNHFSGTAFCIDLGICLIVGFIITSIISMLRVDRKKGTLATS